MAEKKPPQLSDFTCGVCQKKIPVKATVMVVDLKRIKARKVMEDRDEFPERLVCSANCLADYFAMLGTKLMANAAKKEAGGIIVPRDIPPELLKKNDPQSQ